MKNIYIILLAAVAMASCSKGESPEAPFVPELSGGERAIVIASAIETSSTKAAMTDQSELLNVQFLRRDVAADGTIPSNYFTGATAFAGKRLGTGNKAIEFISAPTYSLNDDKVYLVAYHPAGTVATNAASWSVDGKTDILVTNVWDGGKYSAPLTGEGAAKGDPMVFKHQLAQLEVICKADNAAEVSEAAVQDTWGTITKIEMLGTNSKVTFDYTNPTAVTYNTPAAIALVKADYTTTFPGGVSLLKTPNPTITAAGMFAPVASGTAPVRLKIYTSKVTAGQTLDVQLKIDGNGADKGFEKGLKHTVTLVFKASSKDIQVLSTTIDNWTKGYDGTGDMVKP